MQVNRVKDFAKDKKEAYVDKATVEQETDE